MEPELPKEPPPKWEFVTDPHNIHLYPVCENSLLIIDIDLSMAPLITEGVNHYKTWILMTT